LKDTGLRDKDGLELIEGIFSSPEKSVARNSRKNDATLTDSEDMEEAQSRLRVKYNDDAITPGASFIEDTEDLLTLTFERRFSAWTSGRSQWTKVSP